VIDVLAKLQSLGLHINDAVILSQAVPGI
jgi:hypothetical protein